MAKKVITIGGGLAGLIGAIRLAKLGFNVKLFEKNETVGGKMNEISLGDYRFDTGPSLLTMPFVIDELFDFLELDRKSYLDLEPIDPICRYFYPDGNILDASSDIEKMQSEIAKFSQDDSVAYRDFFNYTKKIYDLTNEIFLFTPIHESNKTFKLKNLAILFKIKQMDVFRTVHQSVSDFFTDDRIVQLFNRYSTYNGSNPYQAPATLNIIPYVEYGLGGFYIKGGMYRLVRVLETIAKDFGVDIQKSKKVEKLVHSNKKIEGVVVNGEKIGCDYVLCNMDVVEAFNQMIPEQNKVKNKLNKLEPSLSGMVFLWGVNKSHKQLQHHNIIFSEDYRSEFTQIFEEKKAPSDPTIYISITSKSDVDHAPNNCENWFVLLNMPYLSDGQDWDSEVKRQREIVLKKLRKLNIDIENSIEEEAVITPEDFYQMYESNKGSIYGISSNNRNTAFRRPPNRSRSIENLYFAGGSTHPGGGVPLVILSGKMAADLISEKEKRF
jgi:phytoene desaturase